MNEENGILITNFWLHIIINSYRYRLPFWLSLSLSIQRRRFINELFILPRKKYLLRDQGQVSEFRVGSVLESRSVKNFQ